MKKPTNITSMKELRAKVRDNLERQSKKQAKVWVVDDEFPHVITQRSKGKDSIRDNCFDNINEAFKYRQDISKNYHDAHEKASEFDRFRD